ncbi:MAG TPA: hypothetical protein VFA94_02440, partial [Acidimicrobiales bacterium]|nr:hypothetical protein [Acidimicrobiales bacterium]
MTTAALDHLRAAADQARAGWLPQRWERIDGPGPDGYAVTRFPSLHGPMGGIDGDLALEPGQELTIRCDLPDGERLDLMLWSLFPTAVRQGGRSLLDDDVPPAACGPALIPLEPGGRLELTVRAFDHQLYRPWHWFRFTTTEQRRRFEELDVAWAQLYLADALAVTAGERAAVGMAAGHAAVGRYAAMVEALAPLGERIAAREVHLVGHSHIDLNWLWRMPDTVQIVLRDIRSVLALLDDYPEMTFTHSQPASYRMVQEHAPELFSRIRAHIAAGRWEPATLQWVEGDTNMASSEATARQALEAVLYARTELGASPTVLLAPDTFGHAGNLPQIVASAGGRFYYHHRCNPGWPAYWWEGQDGTRLLAVSTPTYSGDITAGDLARAAVAGGDSLVSMHFYGVGDHGGGPTREALDALRRLQGQPLLPTARCSTVARYAEAVSADNLPVHRGESATTFEGCYTTHADTKRFNRHGENLLQTAETLAALAGHDDAERLGDLVEAWRTVLFNQFHDILDGSAIREVYEDQAADFEAVAELAGVVT